MSTNFDHNKDAAAQEYNRYRTMDAVTGHDEQELRSIPDNELDTVQPTVRDEDGVRSVVSEPESVNRLEDEADAGVMDQAIATDRGMHGHVASDEIAPAGTIGMEDDMNTVDVDQEEYALDDEDAPLPDVPDADEFNGGETPEDPSVPSSYDQDAHGTDLRNGSVGDDEIVDDVDRRLV
ncbi:hypothetical protein SK066_18695 [Paenibacillus hunanensis]|uniref:hypothetical protein n=1 Tax=Paenibacillus hunanensis TaxID=539262 RepID=UPI002A6A871B|nr:hypothetical protein [Paenibacillus hunanensis]WPP40602.1 hypothetical protein SK066_18695 [Paenibacillus hunanensis]